MKFCIRAGHKKLQIAACHKKGKKRNNDMERLSVFSMGKFRALTDHKKLQIVAHMRSKKKIYIR